jgi:hypothetical protein
MYKQFIINRKHILFSIFLIVVITIYSIFDPATISLFPKCPVYIFTGLKCPGCGSQRALHNLLNLNIAKAFTENQLMIISIPYLLLGVFFEFLNNPTPKQLYWRRILFGQKAIYVLLVSIILFTIIRNFN